MLAAVNQILPQSEMNSAYDNSIGFKNITLQIYQLPDLRYNSEKVILILYGTAP